MPDVKAAPPVYKGHLLKESPNQIRWLIGRCFQRRHFVLQGGQLSWSEADGSKSLGSIDFSKTCALLQAVEGSDDKFILRPADGNTWSDADQHTGSGTARAFILDARGCEPAREEWLGWFTEHMQFGQSLVPDRHPLLPLAGLTLNLKPLTELPSAPKGPRVVFVLGGPGSGKGTQCSRVAETLGYVHLSAGDLLREERKRPDSEYGELIETHIREGKLVPADITVKLLQKAMKAKWDGGRYLIDGFPRSMDNLEAWESGVGHTAQLQFVLFLECTEACMESRLLERGKTSGRSDDNAETIKKRFRTFQEESLPVVERYEQQGLLRRVDATLDLEAVWQKVERAFGPDVVFVLGGPGSGKGTQCERISAMCGYKHLSAGDLLREERQRPGSELGDLIEQHIREGKLVPAEITVKLLEKAMREHSWDRGRFLIDGFPRSMENLDAWEKVIGSKAIIKFVLFFECSEECMEGRLLERGKTSGRSDDNIESIRKRFRTFKTDSLPVVVKFEDQGLLRRVNAEVSVEEVWAKVQLIFAPSVVFILGGPGSGKGTHSKTISSEFGYIHLSTGDLLRDERKRPGSQHAEMIERTIQDGQLVPDHIVVELVVQAMERGGWEGGRYLIDGFPRSIKNLECWLGMCGGRVAVKFGLVFECSEAVLTRRLLKRGEDSGRSDDNLETIKMRLRTFQSESMPVIRELEAEGLIRRVDSDRSKEEVWEDVEGHFGPEVVFVLGGPGSGKGTQCDRISRTFSYRHLSAGDLLREESALPTSELGQLIQGHMKQGTLVPAEITVKLLQQAMKRSGWDGKFLIDGFPRSADNWDAWMKVMGKKAQIKFCLFFECSEACMEARILERGKTSGRTDDNIESLKKRFRTFTTDSMPVVERFESQGLVRRINAETSIADVWRNVRSLFGPTVVFVLGGPGSGKGTQCSRIAKAFQYTHLSAGDLLREEQNRCGSEYGELIKSCIRDGILVPADIIARLLIRAMEKGGWAGGRYLIDGFPRSMENLTCWRRNVGESAHLSCCIFFHCSEEVMKSRLLERGKTSGRSDDNIDSIRKRFVTFYEDSLPVVEAFKVQGLLQHINADRTVDDVWRDVQGLFGPNIVCIMGEHILGKSEHCQRLAESCRYKYLSTSDLLAEHSEKVAALEKEGKPASSELVVGLIRKAMLRGGWEKGKYLLDGFPRSMENLKVWKQIMGDTVALKLVVGIETPDESLEAKCRQHLSRGTLSEEEFKKAIKSQIADMRRELEPVATMLARDGVLRTIDGKMSSELLWKSIARLIAPTVIFVLGGPGTGKGTQCSKISNSFGFHHLSAGDLLREERKRPGSELGELIENCIREGKLVPEHITVQLLLQAMEERGWEFSRYLIDGFPRSLDNLACWQEQVGDRVDVRCAIFFECSEKVMEERLLERGKTSGRSDDNLDSIKKRFKTFIEQSLPVSAKIEEDGLLRRINAEHNVSDVWTCVQEVLRNEVEGNANNRAMILVKPHANKQCIVRFVTSTLISRNIKVLQTGTCSAKNLEEKGLFQKMYFQIMNNAEADPKTLTVPQQGLARFKEAFGENWDDALNQDRVENAFSAACRLGKNSKELLDVWYGANFIQLAPKLLVGRVLADDSQLYVVNGFALHMRESFITGEGLTWLMVEWNPGNLSYKKFRADILGATNPAQASKDSLRGQIYANWKDLGLREQPTTLDNCIHTSAGSLEAMREIRMWLGVDSIQEDPTGRMLISSGVPQATLEAWLENPHVDKWPASAESDDSQALSGPIFDCTEGYDAGALRDSAVRFVKQAGIGLKAWTLTVQEDMRSQHMSERSDTDAKPSKSNQDGPDSITILHFNDVYNVEPRKQEPVGGIARFVTRVKQLKQEGIARGEPEPIVLFSGDAFNPSLTSTITKGEHMVPALNAVGIHTAVYGNHDFDWGIDQLVTMARSNNFPWLISNVIDKHTGKALADGIISRVVEMAGHKVGLIGLVESEWLATLSTIDPDDVDYEDFCVCGRRLASDLKKTGAEIVIALTHMRVPNDELLACTVSEVDIILGGHDHHYDVKPVGPHGTYVLKSGTDFRDITGLTIEFTASKQRRFKVVNTWHEEIVSSIPEDPAMKKFVEECMRKVGTAMDDVLGETAVELDSRFSSIRTMETNIGNFVVDIMRAALKSDICMLNSGTYRADALIPVGSFRMRDLVNLLPMLDEMCKLELSGKQVIEALENSVCQYPRLEGRFAQVSGIKFTFDAAKPGGNRVVEASVMVGSTPLDLEKKYTVTTKDYLRQGKDGYDVFKGAVCLCDGEQAGMIQTTVRDHFLQVSHLNGNSAKEARRTKRASVIAPDLARVGNGPAAMQRYAIEPKVEGRIVCMNPATS